MSSNNDNNGSMEEMKTEEEVEIEEEHTCVSCGSSPCEWHIFGNEIRLLASDNAGHTDKQMRFMLYREFTRLKWGHLGRNIRRPLPECILEEIKSLFPDSDGEYVGFKEATGAYAYE